MRQAAHRGDLHRSACGSGGLRRARPAGCGGHDRVRRARRGGARHAPGRASRERGLADRHRGALRLRSPLRRGLRAPARHERRSHRAVQRPRPAAHGGRTRRRPGLCRRGWRADHPPHRSVAVRARAARRALPRRAPGAGRAEGFQPAASGGAVAQGGRQRKPRGCRRADREVPRRRRGGVRRSASAPRIDPGGPDRGGCCARRRGGGRHRDHGGLPGDGGHQLERQPARARQLGRCERARGRHLVGGDSSRAWIHDADVAQHHRTTTSSCGSSAVMGTRAGLSGVE